MRETVTHVAGPGRGTTAAPGDQPDAVEVEIVHDPGLTAAETALLDLHSFLNIVTVLLGELYRLRTELSAPSAWEQTVRTVDRVATDLRSGRFDRSGLDALARVEAGFERETREVFDARPDPVRRAELQGCVSNLRSVLQILTVRLSEYVGRLERPDAWVPHAVRELEAGMSNALAAIERNSGGRYRIVSNIARQEHADYVVDLRIESDEGSTLTMPAVMQDVLRDLVANARKYTPPGGVINAGVYRSDRELSLVVEDDGMGIPADELTRVVDFGYRATNARERRTHGGGFGLTKAYWLTRRFGGRMWIRSQLGAGTRVTIRIPVPASRRARSG